MYGRVKLWALSAITLSFIAFLVLTTLIGISASLKAKPNSKDYLLANRNIGPVTMALSAVATALSGFMFIGYIGFIYKFGLSTIWYSVTWILGNILAWNLHYKNIRQETEKKDIETISSLAANCVSEKKTLVVQVASVITIVFLGVYAAAQLKAGAKTLHAVLDWDMGLGIIVAAVIVAAYCFSGGIRASIWTDVAQSILMLLAMVFLAFICLQECGGVFTLFEKLKVIDASLVNLIPENLEYGFPIFLLSLFVNGYLVIGQPHISIRTMLIDSSENLPKAKLVYFSYYAIFCVLTTIIGLCGRVLMPELGSFDPELILPQLSMQMMPSILVGLVLAGLFSSIISTADSQLLSCSAAITQDLNQNWKSSLWASKLATLTSLAVILVIAFAAQNSVFDLVLIAWSILGCTLGPLIILDSFKVNVSRGTAITMMLTAFVVVIYWHFGLHLNNHIHEALPGFLAAFLVFAIRVLWRRFG